MSRKAATNSGSRLRPTAAFRMIALAALLAWSMPAGAGPPGTEGDLYLSADTSARQYDGETGAFAGAFAGGLAGGEGLAFGPNGNLFVANRTAAEVIEYDGCTGAFVRALGGGSLEQPWDLAFGPTGNLLVASFGGSEVIEYDSATGDFVRALSGGGLSLPTGLTFGPNGNLFVSSSDTDSVIEFDAATGAPVGEFAGGGSLDDPRGLVFGPNGNLFVASFGTNEVLEFDGTTGASVGTFVSAGSGGLEGPEGLVFGPDPGQNLFVVSSDGSNSVIEYDGGTGAVVGPFVGYVTGRQYLVFKQLPDFALQITDFVPSQAENCGLLSGAGVIGTGLAAGCGLDGPNEAKLTRPGSPDIVGAITQVSPFAITVDFDLTGVALGFRDLVLTYPDEQSYALVDAIEITQCPPPAVTAMAPTEADNCQPLAGATITGIEFVAGATVKLTRTGQNDIVGTNVDVQSPTAIVGDFDFTGAAAGYWDAVVANPDGQSDTLVDAIEITPCPPLAVTELSPAQSNNCGMLIGATIAGSEIVGSVTVRLRRLGHADILGTVTDVSPTRIVVDFDVTGAVTGPWDVVVATGTQLGVLPDTLVITECPRGRAGDLYVRSDGEVLQFDGVTGQIVGTFVPPGSFEHYARRGLAWLPSGNLVVADVELVDGEWMGAVKEFDGVSGGALGYFVAAGAGGLEGPRGLAVGPNGNLFVVSDGSNEVIEYDGTTGSLVGTFVGGEHLDHPQGLTFGGPSGNLFVTSGGSSDGSIQEFNGTTGAFIRTYYPPGDAPLGTVAFGPNGNLFAGHGSSYTYGVVSEFDVSNGQFVGTFVSEGGAGDLTFGGPNSDLFVLRSVDVDGSLVGEIARFDGFVPDVDRGAVAVLSGNNSYHATLAFKPCYGSFPEPEVMGFSPPVSEGCVLDIQTATVTGNNLLPHCAQVRLTMAGEPDVVGRVVAGVEPTSVVAEFNLFGAAAGVWDLVFAYPDGPSTTLTEAFENIPTPCSTPEVTGIDPATVSNCESLVEATITGTDFMPGATVTLTMLGEADIAGTNVEVESTTTIIADFDITAVAHGPWDVVVTNLDDQTDTLVDGVEITWCPLDVTDFSPSARTNCGPLADATISGMGFMPGVTARLTREGAEDIEGSNLDVQFTTITADFNLTDVELGFWNLLLTDPESDTATLVDAIEITECPPSITGFAPEEAHNCGPLSGATISGAGFDPGAIVTLYGPGDDIVGTNVDVQFTAITADFDVTDVPAGQWDVRVANPAGPSATMSNALSVAECDDQTSACPNPPLCPPGGILQEPECGGDYNSGCWGTGEFVTLTCGDAICGTSGTYVSGDTDYRDGDWYELELAEPTTVTITFTAEFAGGIEVDGPVEYLCARRPRQFVEAPNPCETGTLTACLDAGRYELGVSPYGFGEEWPCYLEYVLTIDCEGSCEPPAGPENDDCINASPVTDGDTLFSNVAATTDGPIIGYAGNFTRDIWYDYEATCTGLATVSLCQSVQNFDTVLAVYEGSGCEPLGDQRAFDDDYCRGGGPSQTTLSVFEDESYLIRVGGWNYAEGEGILSVSCEPADEGACCHADGTCTVTDEAGCAAAGGTYGPGGTCPGPTCPPLNDQCVNVIPQRLPATFVGDNRGATDDCGGLFAPANPPVWHAFTIDECMDVTVDYCGTSPPFANAYVVVFEECCQRPWISSSGWQDCGDGNLAVSFSGLTPGTYYYPILTAAPDSYGPYTVTITGAAVPCPETPPPPVNDECTDAIAITGDGAVWFDTGGATTDGPDEPGHCDDFGYTQLASDIWYCYTATCSSRVVADFVGSAYDTKVAVYEGCSCPPAGDPVACNDTTWIGGASRVEFEAIGGQQYLIRVGGALDDSGPGVMNLFCTGACCFEDGGCADLTETECVASDGVFDPDGSCAEVACPLPDRCADAVYSNGPRDEVNGLSHFSIPGLRRSILADFVLPEASVISEFHSEMLRSGGGTGYELAVYEDNTGAPGALVATLNVTGFAEMDTGLSIFGLPLRLVSVDVEPVVLDAGTYWLEMHSLSGQSGFQPTAEIANGTPCWVDYEDYGGLQPGIDVFGVDYDVTFCLGWSPCGHKGDGNGDCRIDLSDFSELASCLVGPASPADLLCECYDLNDDGSVDLADFALFQAAFTTSGTVLPDCLEGACCHLDGSCTVTTAAECAGAFQGESTTCVADLCPFGAYANEFYPSDGTPSYIISETSLAFADDLTLAGTGARELVYLDLAVVALGGGPFDVTASLYTACPGDGGTLIPGTTITWRGIPDDGTVRLLTADELDPPVTIPDTVWMVAEFSSPEAGWVIAQVAERGSTGNVFGADAPPWGCNFWFGGWPHAGFWANLRCVPEGARSSLRGQGDSARVNIFPMPHLGMPTPIENIESAPPQAAGPSGRFSLDGVQQQSGAPPRMLDGSASTPSLRPGSETPGPHRSPFVNGMIERPKGLSKQIPVSTAVPPDAGGD